VNFQTAALLVEHGIAPQDYEGLSEEFDLLQVSSGVLHDPETCADLPEHLEELLRDPIVWLPGVVPYGDLWKDLRFGVPPQRVRLCPICYARAD
jgi:hypothetical protein